MRVKEGGALVGTEEEDEEEGWANGRGADNSRQGGSGSEEANKLSMHCRRRGSEGDTVPGAATRVNLGKGVCC